MEKSKKIVVVDASVVAKWFIDEEYTGEALKMREDYKNGVVDIWSTQLMPFEVLNALRYNPEFSQKEIEKAANALSRYRIALYPLLNDLRESCVRIALKYGITIYDASYISLGYHLNKELYTADEKLLTKIGKDEEEAVHHIREYPA